MLIFFNDCKKKYFGDWVGNERETVGLGSLGVKQGSIGASGNGSGFHHLLVRNHIHSLWKENLPQKTGIPLGQNEWPPPHYPQLGQGCNECSEYVLGLRWGIFRVWWYDHSRTAGSVMQFYFRWKFRGVADMILSCPHLLGGSESGFLVWLAAQLFSFCLK